MPYGTTSAQKPDEKTIDTVGERMVELAIAMRVKHERDEDSGRMISGRRGNIHLDGDQGYSVSVMLKTRSSLRKALSELVPLGLEVRQLGDWEAVLFMPRNPRPESLPVVRKWLKIRKRPDLKPETVEKRVKQAHLLNKDSLNKCESSSNPEQNSPNSKL
jgi:hypothetical protein